MSSRTLDAELFLRNNTIRITNDEQRVIGELLYSYYYKNGSVEEFECGGMTLRIKQRDIAPNKLFGSRLNSKPKLTKIWLFCNDEKLITLRTFQFYGVDHQSIHINSDYEYFDDLMLYLRLSLS